ncbi:MAG TPA: 23S rRNA (adenine(2503)-C(2))-methyltransferase RlmN [Gammaproteobacteria bacterium]|nr:23S rRNA (adenine(2503)-C(2))-methyltransferase RlmN [Gammaproteobacteria bacterium]
MSSVEPINLLGLDRDGLAEFFRGLGEQPFRSQQVMQWIHQHGVADFEAMTNLGKALRARLGETAEVRPPQVLAEREAADGTRKWLLRMDGGNAVETVFIPEAGRGTLCVSSQVGCSLDCAFCATGAQGFNRNLSAAEILGQVWVANRALGFRPRDRRGITNVVLMGMGEPLHNFRAVVPAMRVLLDDLGYGLSRRRVTLSTSGVVPKIDQLRETCDVALAVSLHAPDDALRDRLVPINRKYPLAELLAACRRYVRGRGSKTSITFEYVMLDGVNDSPEHARALVRRLQGIPAKVNLIPFNPFPGSTFRRSPDAAIQRFSEILHHKGVRTTVRRPRGDDIEAACGQLAGRFEDRTRRRGRQFPEVQHA